VVYQVDTSSFDLLFDGGSLDFKLEVREGAAAVREVPVTLNVTTNITPESITIFSVTRTPAQTGDEEGSLTKINATLEVGEESVSVATLLDAFKWIDQSLDDDEATPSPEYLVRVEKDEAIPRVVLTLNNKGTAIIRLRGYQEERKITWDGDESYYYAHPDLSISSSFRTALITIGRTNVYTDITLQLEQDITLDGEETITGNAVRNMVRVMGGRTLSMKSGSKITGCNTNGRESAATDAVIYVNGRGSIDTYPTGHFILDGGEITGNVVYKGIIYLAGQIEDGRFIYKSGKIDGNFKYNSNDHGNYIIYYDGSIEEIQNL
jgi:hypothetical protein